MEVLINSLLFAVDKRMDAKIEQAIMSSHAILSGKVK